MRQVLDAHELEMELAGALREPAHLRPALTLLLIQILKSSDPGKLEAVASAAGERLRRADTLGLVDERTFAVLLVGASPAAAGLVATELEELVQPLLEDEEREPTLHVTHGIAGAGAGTDLPGLIAAARADLQRRAERSTELTTI